MDHHSSVAELPYRKILKTMKIPLSIENLSKNHNFESPLGNAPICLIFAMNYVQLFSDLFGDGVNTGGLNGYNPPTPLGLYTSMQVATKF